MWQTFFYESIVIGKLSLQISFKMSQVKKPKRIRTVWSEGDVMILKDVVTSMRTEKGVLMTDILNKSSSKNIHLRAVWVLVNFKGYTSRKVNMECILTVFQADQLNVHKCLPAGIQIAPPKQCLNTQK